MKVFRNPWWWLAVVLFVVHQVVQKGVGLDTGVLDDYLDPALAAPILLGLWVAERTFIWRSGRLTLLETAVATLVLAVIFEEVYPRFEGGFSRDAYDYLFYALGGVYFYGLVNPPRAGASD